MEGGHPAPDRGLSMDIEYKVRLAGIGAPVVILTSTYQYVVVPVAVDVPGTRRRSGKIVPILTYERCVRVG